MKKLNLFLGLLLCTPFLAKAQQSDTSERQMVSAPVAFFVPHWYVKAQGGMAYDVGEAKFSQLLSPAIQLSAGYRFNELLGVRGSLSGLWARNRYAYPEAKYQWNFLQPSVEGELNLTSLILGKDPERKTYVYAFAGMGVAYAFNNDDAVEADQRFGIDFKKLWRDHRWNPVVRAGLGADYRITDDISIGAEVNANMMPDHFNSKLGKKDNRDWHFNALVGVKFNLGRSHGRTEGLYRDVKVPTPLQGEENFVDVPIEKISFNVNIQFLINQSIIRSNQIPKLTRLLKYLNEHPRAFIRLSGYADKETGTPEINMRLSRERAEVVSQYLQDAGIEEWRIRRFAKGDRVQPFDLPEDNRVCICYVYDPDNPVPQPY
jgi:outer membrane protein OmpA-like peptidoglycan-associated protein